jgi:DNA polymerase/3'-5' exonuclease PolX
MTLREELAAVSRRLAPGEKRRLHHALVRPCAEGIAMHLAPACVEIMVAGSLRRHQHLGRDLDAYPEVTVADVDIVLIPRLQRVQRSTGLFDGDGDTGLEPVYDELPVELTARIADWTEHLPRPLLSWSCAAGADGPRRKRLVMWPLDLPVELWLATPANFGNIVAIRTGDRHYSHAFVTPRHKGGLMPDWLVQSGGYLWRFSTPAAAAAAREAEDMTGGERIDCPTEGCFFRALGLEILDPKYRNAEGARRQGARMKFHED